MAQYVALYENNAATHPNPICFTREEDLWYDMNPKR